MRAQLKITSFGNGWKEDISDMCDYSQSDGTAILKYTLDGDECVLTLSRDALFQNRRGKINVDIYFRNGETTSCLLGEGGVGGSYPVFTTSFSSTVGKYGCDVKLSYLSGEDKERINLSVRAVVSKS